MEHVTYPQVQDVITRIPLHKWPDSNAFCGWQVNSTQMTQIDMIFADFNSLSSRNRPFICL